MTTEEFDLSEKIDAIDKIDEEHGLLYIELSDVKEFIRLNDIDLQKVRNDEIMLEEAIERIRKRAGKKLSGEKC